MPSKLSKELIVGDFYLFASFMGDSQVGVDMIILLYHLISWYDIIVSLNFNYVEMKWVPLSWIKPFFSFLLSNKYCFINIERRREPYTQHLGMPL